MKTEFGKTLKVFNFVVYTILFLYLMFALLRHDFIENFYFKWISYMLILETWLAVTTASHKDISK